MDAALFANRDLLFFPAIELQRSCDVLLRTTFASTHGIHLHGKIIPKLSSKSPIDCYFCTEHIHKPRMSHHKLGRMSHFIMYRVFLVLANHRQVWYIDFTKVITFTEFCLTLSLANTTVVNLLFTAKLDLVLAFSRS